MKLEKYFTHPWNYYAEPFQIIENLYYVGNKSVSCHLIDSGDGMILLDTGFPQTLYLLLESIRRLGFDPESIKYIVHTHAHYDHFGGTKALVELIDGVKTVLGEDDLHILEKRPELSWTPEYGVELYESFSPDILLKDGDVISLGNINIECIATPGHTPGTMSFLFEMIDNGQAYTVGIYGGTGVNTLSEQYLTRYNLPSSCREDYFNSIQKVKNRKVDVFIGSHPGQNRTFAKQSEMTAEKNPFINPSAWGDFMASLESRIQNLTENL